MRAGTGGAGASFLCRMRCTLVRMDFREHIAGLPDEEQAMLLAYLQAPPGVAPERYASNVVDWSLPDTVRVLMSARCRAALEQYAAETRELVARPDVLTMLEGQRDDDVVIDAAWVLQELLRLQQASVRDFLVRRDGRFTLDFENNPAALDDLQAFEMTELIDAEGRTERKVKFKLPDKLAATKLIGEHSAVRAFGERSEADELDELLVSRIRAGRDRLAAKHKTKVKR